MNITIKPDAQFNKIVLGLNKLPETMRQAVTDAMEASTITVVSKARKRPRMPLQTGTLARSLGREGNVTKVTGNNISNIVGTVGTDLPYAAIHEFGGRVTRTKAWGRPSKSYTVQYKERRYLRGGLEDSQVEIKRLFELFLTKAVIL